MVRIQGMGKKVSKIRKTDDKNYSRNRLRNLRILALDALGGECVMCGFNDYRALQIDHINGGGSEQRRMGGFGSSFHKYVIDSYKKDKNEYQLLCANCNWIKRAENNEVKKCNRLTD